MSTYKTDKVKATGNCLVAFVVVIIVLGVTAFLLYQMLILGHTSGPAGLNSY
jgi:hypothetical protein